MFTPPPHCPGFRVKHASGPGRAPMGRGRFGEWRGRVKQLTKEREEGSGHAQGTEFALPVAS